MPPPFDYNAAFSRNVGLVQPEEQTVLRQSRVAVAGLGGVGGAHVLTLARLGIGHLHIADFDVFELENFNRQAGALMSTVGRAKVEVMRAMALDIDPEAEVCSWPQGITSENIEAFLRAVDVVVDGLDFFAVDARSMLYREAYARQIPVVAAGPIGCSVSLTVFLPGGMTWHDFFGMSLARTELDKYILFYLGNAPANTQRGYLDATSVRLEQRRGPSLVPAVALCSGAATVEVIKLLLKRGPVYGAPYYQQYDAYQCVYVRRKLRWGNRGPLQRLRLAIARKKFRTGAAVPPESVAAGKEKLLSI